MASEQQVGNIVYEVEMNVAKLLEAQKQVNDRLNKMEGSFEKSSQKADRFQSSLNKVGAAIAATFTVDAAKRLLDIADQMNILQARIARLSPSIEVARQTMASLSAIASQTGSSLSDTERLWESLTSALKETGATNNQIVALTSTLQKIGTIGGSSADEMSNALRQFGQSIAGGVVRAEEFNSILEQMPELARQIAAGMGISIGELRKRMLDGKLTAEDALNAIQKQSATVSSEFAKMPRTMQQATNSLEISFQTLIKNVNDATGASQTMVMIVDSLTMALDRLMGKSSTAAQQISDLTSTAEMFERRARTWSWLGLDGWEAQNKALAGLSNKAAALVQDMDAVSKATSTAANTKPIKIPEPAGNSTSALKGSAKAAKEVKTANNSAADSIERMNQKLARANTGFAEGSLAMAKYDAVMELGSDATQQQIAQAERNAEALWKITEATRAATQAENDRKSAQSNFTSLQGQASPVAAADNTYQQQMAQLDQYVQLYPQKIAEAEAVRNAIEQQYRQQRLDAMWQEWAQQSEVNQLAANAFDALGNNASSALSGILTGTESAGDAMRGLANSVVNQLLNSFVQMGIEWAKSAILGATTQQTAIAATTAAQTAAVATQTAVSTTAAATTAAAWTPAAILSSIASMGTAAAIGLGAVAGVIGANLLGKRKNGGPVSAGGLYQVGESGLPEIYQASNGKQYMIPGDNGSVISNKDMQGGGAASVVINVQNYSGATVDAQASSDGNGGVTIDMIVADLNNGGPVSQGIVSNFNVKRKARGQG
ncbi:tape measure protein [Mixta calida]|uniref:tape measure protein n=1 Tax=Mixta calida TaxID=665913 RepID=UPI003CE8D0FC